MHLARHKRNQCILGYGWEFQPKMAALVQSQCSVKVERHQSIFLNACPAVDGRNVDHLTAKSCDARIDKSDATTLPLPI